MLTGKNIGTQGVQKTQGAQRLFFVNEKPFGSGNTQWTPNSYNKVNPTSMFSYDVQWEKKK